MLTLWTNVPAYLVKPEIKDLKCEAKIHTSSSIPAVGEGDVLVCMGGGNLKSLQNESLLPKNRTITSLREVPHKIGDGVCFITFDVDIKGFDHTSYVKLQTDLRLVNRYVNTGSTDCVLGSYSWVSDYNHLPELINEEYNATGKAVRVALDLETVGLNPFDPDKFIVSISFSFEEGISELIRFTSVEGQPDPDSVLRDVINWLLNDGRISLIGANLKYDLLWIWLKWGIQCTNFKLDTTLVGSLLDENRSNSLNTHTKVYTNNLGGYDDALNAEFDKSRMDLIPSENLLPYAGGDTDATLRVGNRMVKLLTQSKSQTNFYTKLLHPASMAFLDMERTGIYVDKTHFDNLQKKLMVEMDELTAQARKLLPARILVKYDGKFALSKASIIKEYMFTHSHGLKLKPMMVTEKTGQPSTAYNHLVMFEDVPEAKKFIGILKKWNSAKKTLSTYVVGFMKHLREDGRLHPTAILYRGDYGGADSGTITGRTAFKDPAFQTLPKHTIWAKPLREGYVAPEGYCIVNFDYSQGELRVIACVANETNMIKAYKQGIDLHLKTGAELNGYTIEEAMAMKLAKDPSIKMIRQGGKAGNFGLIYGISADGFVIYARDTYGVIVELEEAQAQKDKFFGMYPALVDYHEEYKEFAHEHEFVQSPLGRVRHLPLINSNNWSMKGQAERQSINAPIQSTLSDLTQLSLSEFKNKHGYHPDCRFFAMTHDSLTAYIKTDCVDIWVPEVKNIMETLPLEEYFGWTPQLNFDTDAEVGFNMASMVELADYPNKAPTDVLNLISN